MAIADCTAQYVDLLTYGKYASQTADSASFEAIKSMMSLYLNTNTEYLPDTKYTHALALLVAHYYALGTDVTPPDAGIIGGDLKKGAIISEKVGDIQITYADESINNSSPGGGGFVSASQDWLLLSVYGKQYLKLMASFKSSFLVL